MREFQPSPERNLHQNTSTSELSITSVNEGDNQTNVEAMNSMDLSGDVSNHLPGFDLTNNTNNDTIANSGQVDFTTGGDRSDSASSLEEDTESYEPVGEDDILNLSNGTTVVRDEEQVVMETPVENGYNRTTFEGIGQYTNEEVRWTDTEATETITGSDPNLNEIMTVDRDGNISARVNDTNFLQSEDSEGVLQGSYYDGESNFRYNQFPDHNMMMISFDDGRVALMTTNEDGTFSHIDPEQESEFSRKIVTPQSKEIQDDAMDAANIVLEFQQRADILSQRVFGEDN